MEQLGWHHGRAGWEWLPSWSQRRSRANPADPTTGDVEERREIADLSGRMIGAMIRLAAGPGRLRSIDVEVRQVNIDANDAGLHAILRRGDADAIGADIDFTDVYHASDPAQDLVFAYIGEFCLDQPIEVLQPA